MACPNPEPDDVPAVCWVVARREEDPPHFPLYYVGPKIGWTDQLSDAAVWPSVELASAVAAIFPRAAAIRVLIWEPLSIAHQMDDLVDLMSGE